MTVVMWTAAGVLGVGLVLVFWLTRERRPNGDHGSVSALWRSEHIRDRRD